MLLLICSTAYRGVAQSNTDTGDVVVYELNDAPPANAKKISNIKIGDGGFKFNCGYAQTVEQAKEKARWVGGNLIKITEIRKPDMWSSCYRLHADVYVVGNIAEYKLSQRHVADSICKSLLPDTASYALLYVYRSTGVGPLVQYNLHVNDSMVCRVKFASKFIVKLHKAGPANIWARTETREAVVIDVKPGSVYFLKCEVRMGALVGEPKFTLANPVTGLREFEEIKYNDD